MGPNCKSRNTTAVAVVEHVVCGCVRPRAEFEADGEFVCPKCESGIESLDEAVLSDEAFTGVG